MLFASPEEKKVHQNRRILKDEPWIWAIRQDWQLQSVEIKIRQADKWAMRMHDFLRLPPPDDEVWVLYGETSRTCVARVYACCTMNTAQCILSLPSLRSPESLLVQRIAVASKPHVGILEIFRPSKKDGSFNAQLIRAAKPPHITIAEAFLSQV